MNLQNLIKSASKRPSKFAMCKQNPSRNGWDISKDNFLAPKKAVNLKRPYSQSPGDVACDVPRYLGPVNITADSTGTAVRAHQHCGRSHFAQTEVPVLCYTWFRYTQWRTSTPGIEVAQKCSVSNGAQTDWFCDSICIWELNHQIILPLLHYWRHIFAQPLSLASTYLIMLCYTSFLFDWNHVTPFSVIPDSVIPDSTMASCTQLRYTRFLLAFLVCHKVVLADISAISWWILFQNGSFMPISFMVLSAIWSILASPDVNHISGTMCTQYKKIWPNWWFFSHCSKAHRPMGLSPFPQNQSGPWLP